MKLKYDTLIFDTDGTLLDSLQDIVNAVNIAIKECGYDKEYTYKEGFALIGSGAHELARRAFSFTDASEETLMDIALEAGAEDIKTSAEGFEVITAPENFDTVKAALEGKNIKLASAEITMLPSNEVDVSDVEAAGKIVRLIEALDEHDDTKEVYSNDKISEEVLAKIEDK